MSDWLAASLVWKVSKQEKLKHLIKLVIQLPSLFTGWWDIKSDKHVETSLNSALLAKKSTPGNLSTDTTHSSMAATATQVNGDNRHELITFTVKTRTTSSSSLLDTQHRSNSPGFIWWIKIRDITRIIYDTKTNMWCRISTFARYQYLTTVTVRLNISKRPSPTRQAGTPSSIF